jgi:metal-sulfur cluster biosynthetic enzyme
VTPAKTDPLVGDCAIERNAWECLLEVYDPELGIDLVNLGLIYELRAKDGVVTVAMTLTTPGCPMGGSIPDQVRFSLETVPGVREAQVELVWEPQWEPEMMSDTAKHALGWL